MPALDVRPASDTQRALLLDFDGTLADTLPGLRRVYANFLSDVGADDRAPHFDNANGADLSVLISDLCRQFAPQRNAEDVWSDYWAAVERVILAAEPASGAPPLMSWARRQGWRLGIATAGRTGLIAAWLDKHQLSHFIDCVIGADLCERGKPDPMPYRLLMERLDILPKNGIAIEDSVSGIASARSAGAEVIRLLHDKAAPVDGTACEVATLGGALQYLANRFDPARVS